MKRWFKKFFAAVALLAVVGYFGFSLFTANELTKPLGRHIEFSPEIISPNFENIKFKTSDGLNLKGWLYRNTSDKLIIFVHGMRGNRHDTGYALVGISQELIAQGYNILTFDGRAHGESDGKRFGYGANEGKDVVAAVDFAQSQGFEPAKTAIIANSTGAITALMVIDQIPDIGTFVIDSAATNFQPIVADRLWEETHVPFPFHPTIFLFSKVFFGVDFATIRPIDKLKLVPEKPILYLTCLHDETTKVSESQKLLAASNQNSKLVIFPKGGHIETYKKNPDLYQSSVYPWLEGHLN